MRTSNGVKCVWIVYAAGSWLAHSSARAEEHAVQNSWFGSTGGVRVVDASSGAKGSLRLQLGVDYFRSHDFLAAHDTDQALSGALSLSATLLDQLEVFAAYGTRSNSNDKGDPTLLQVSGDLSLGAKTFLPLSPWLRLGGDLRVLFLNSVGDVGLTGDATSVGLRAALTADLRELPSPLPLIVRTNVGYLLDNSHNLVRAEEHQRYAAISPGSRRSEPNEDRQLITRIERFGLGVNRLDSLGIGLGVEAPLQVLPDFFVQPLVEWQIGIPINRQAFDCLSVSTDGSARSADSCLVVEGAAAVPSTLTAGARVLPPVRGLSVLLALDIGLLGTRTFVRELAPTRPWAVLLAVGYGIDTRPPKPQVRYVSRPAPPLVAAAVAAPVARVYIEGEVVERGTNNPVIGAVIRYPERELSPQLTGAEGRFVSYPFDASGAALTFEVTHPDYDSSRCEARLPAAASGNVPLRCELSLRARLSTLAGRVSDEHGQALAGIRVALTGPDTRELISGSAGELSANGLPTGEYSAHVDDKNYLAKTQPFTIEAGAQTPLQLSLIERPKLSHVVLAQHEIKISMQVAFKANSAEIDVRSTGLLSEVADVLVRNAQLQRVQVQGHTDNRGNSAQNRELSQRRAESVVAWLVAAGVDPARLEAKGFGDERPLVPNLTPDNRARNRRVQFVVIDKK